MDKKSEINKIPFRIKYYLLEWKDKNMEEYLKIHDNIRLHDLNKNQLHELFSYASTKDSALLSKQNDLID